MIELENDQLVFSFPDVHPRAQLAIEFQRTLRIPDDDRNYPLPPGLGRFPISHVDDFKETVPASWIMHGGVMLPMYQSEAMWLNLNPKHVDDRDTEYPFAIKVAAGKINAVTGGAWSTELHQRPQDYMVAPSQPWLDGFCVEKGIIRQFVAMPLGARYTAEEQITGKAEYGGVQIVVYPMKREAFERRFPKQPLRHAERFREYASYLCCPAMGLAPGGRMKQHIYRDPYSIHDWDQTQHHRCFVHIANSLVWRAITGKLPPTTPRTAKEYTSAGLPWFEYYDDESTPLDGSGILDGLKGILAISREKQDVALPENETVEPVNLIELRKGLKKGEVRAGTF